MKQEKVNSCILNLAIVLQASHVTVCLQEKMVRELTGRIETESKRRETGWSLFVSAACVN